MIYIDALNLINLCLSNDILQGEDDRVFVYREGKLERSEGWYLDSKDSVAKELMHDNEGVKALILELMKLDVDFVPTKIEDFHINKI